MMNQQLDNFFREKLANYRKPAPGDAWDRVASALDKPGNSFSWWKIAASLLLLSTLGYILWFHGSPSLQQPVVQTESKNPPARQENDQEKINPPVESPHQSITHESIAASTENSSSKKDNPKKNKKQPSITPTLSTATPHVVEERPAPIEAPTSETSPVDLPPTKKSAALTLIVTVDETNQYLDKNAIAQATPEEKKTSTFKKLLRKANDLKSNQDPFGDLREKKNEILALNFKNEKRGQNK